MRFGSSGRSAAYADPSAVPQPSVGKAFATWLFGGSTPMDDARANAAALEQAHQNSQLRAAMLSKLSGALGGADDAAPAPPQDAPPPPRAPQAFPIKDANQRLTSDFGGQDAIPMMGDVGVKVPKLDIGPLPMRGAAAPAKARGGPPTLRGSADWLLPAMLAGVPGAKEIAGYLKDAQPERRYENGVGYDVHDDKTPAFIPKMDNGQEPVFNARGDIIGVRNMDGSIKAASEMAGAVTGAQEGAKAGFDVGKYDLPNGATQQATRLQAVQALTGGGAPAGLPMVGGPRPAPGGLPSGFGRSQTPADKKLAEGRADTQVSREAAAPKAFSGLTDQARTTDLVVDTISKVLGESLDPKTGQFVHSGDPMISGWTAGMGANLAGIKGLPAHDLQATMDTIRANVGFDALAKMRENSPTGGALGAVSENENRLLQSVLGSLDAGQSPEQLATSLRQIRDQLAHIRGQRTTLFNQTYGGQGGGQASAGGRGGGLSSIPAADRLAEARRRGLIP